MSDLADRTIPLLYGCSHYRPGFVASKAQEIADWVESIVANRLSALAAECDELKSDLNNEATALQEAEAELAAAQKNQLDTERAYTRLRNFHDMQMDAARAECDALQARLELARVTWANCKTGWRLPRDVKRGMDAALDEGNTP